MTSRSRIRTLALSVITIGGWATNTLAAQTEPETDWYTCMPSGSCATTNADAACAAIKGAGWFGFCGSAGTPFANPCPEDKDKLHCFPPVILP